MSYGARGLGVGPDDSCYDPNHPWWKPNFWNTDAECACIAAQQRPIGEQCFTVSGLYQTMTGQVKDVTEVGAAPIVTALTGAAEGIASSAVDATSAAVGVSQTTSTILLGIAAVFGGILLVNLLKGAR